MHNNSVCSDPSITIHKAKSFGVSQLILAFTLAVISMFIVTNAAQAQSIPVTTNITADNYFKLCHGTPGSPGWLTCTSAYDDWKTPHALTVNANATDYLYIVAWSDDSVAQGVLAEIIGFPNTNLPWEVHPTADNRDTLAQEPTTVQIESNITGTWHPVTVSSNLPNGGTPFTNGNASSPWAPIAGINSLIPWMWYDSHSQTGSQAPFIGGFNHNEYLIFRLPVAALLCEACGAKFHDENGNRQWDANESGLANWPIVLVDQNGNAQMTTTSSSGHFAFTGLASGTYTLYEVAQPGWVQTAPVSGSHTINVVQGQPSAPLFFGNRPCEPFDLQIEKSTNSTFQVGQAIKYDIKVTNNSNTAVAGPITFADTLPVGLSSPVVAPADPSWQCQVAGQTILCTHPGILPPNYSTTFTVDATVGQQAFPKVENCAEITASDEDNLDNNQSCVTNDVTGDDKPKGTGDLGDAPDSTNHFGAEMMTYFGSVLANFPTIFAGDPIPGPIHWKPKGVAWLGKDVSDEADADQMPDIDGVTNIEPPAMIANRDWHDDGIQFDTLALPECAETKFAYDVTAVSGAEMFVNVWFDFNRDGDWDDVLECRTEKGTLTVHEWAVQDQIIGFGTGTTSHVTQPFVSMNVPTEDSPMWMRMTLSERKAEQATITQPTGATYTYADGRGPTTGFEVGETEDCLLPINPDIPACSDKTRGEG